MYTFQNNLKAKTIHIKMLMHTCIVLLVNDVVTMEILVNIFSIFEIKNYRCSVILFLQKLYMSSY